MNTKPDFLTQLYVPHTASHKGQNGKLMIIGGSHLFHAASLWALQIASRVVDMVFYSSVAENNLIVEELKKEFRNGIIVRRDDLEAYLDEADAVLIGPGMVRAEKLKIDLPAARLPDGQGKAGNGELRINTLEEINKLPDEGEQSYFLTKYLLEKYPHKKWIIDAGALQMMDPAWLLPLAGNAIVTPHVGEFERVFKLKPTADNARSMAEKYHAIIVLKGEKDIVCSSNEYFETSGGNAGMTKGGTGDVLAGLIAALATKNDLFLAARAGSYFNKKAGEALFEKVGYYFNASDLADEIPRVMKHTLSV